MKRVMTLGMMVVAMAMMFCTAAGTVTVTGVTAQQRYPWDGKVDVIVTLSGTSNDAAQVSCMFVATNNATHSALNISHLTGDGVVSGIGGFWTRRFEWEATADVGGAKIDDVALSVSVPLGGVQLWENGPCWAECNVGAERPEEFGYYFWWGDTVGYSANTNSATWTSGYYWNGVEWVSSTDDQMSNGPFSLSVCPTCGMSDFTLQSQGYVDSTGNLAPAHDAATVHLGAPWRMPTEAEFSTLISKCTTVWTMCNGVYGMLVTGTGEYASKSIFLPAAGIGYESHLSNPGSFVYYWSSAPYLDYPYYSAWHLDFTSYEFGLGHSNRAYGRSVRPLRGFDQSSTATTHLALDCRTGARVVGIAAQQRYPWDGKVDVIVMLSGASNDAVQAVCTFVATNSATRAVLNVSHLTGDGVVSGNGSTWTRRFVWDAAADVGAEKIDDVELTAETEIPLGGVQLWENGPYWAECNVGAMKPEEYGYYFWWGDTVGYLYVDSKWVACDGSSSNFSFWNYNNENPVIATEWMDHAVLKSEGWIGEDGKLAASHDAAAAYLGSPWRMPTDADFVDLDSKCDAIWTMHNGVYGRLVTGRGAYSSKSIFLPAAGFGASSDLRTPGSVGCYWSSTTPTSDASSLALQLYFSSNVFSSWDNHGRHLGQSVRPLREFAQTSTATTRLAVDCRVDPATPVVSPEDGTIFTVMCLVNISCESEGAVVHYTTDGSEPTMASPVYARFKINGRTTVKARAFYENGNGSGTVVAEYALGQCPNPMIVSAGGSTFTRSGNAVSINWTCTDGVVRYTTDGSDVTVESPIYAGPFAIDETTVIKARAFGVEYFDSMQVTVELVREFEKVQSPVITAAEEFTGSEIKVAFTCATPGATIFYTTDGGEPTSHSSKYTGPFWVDKSCTVKAVAMCADYLASEVVSRTITKVWGIGDTMGAPDHAFATSGDAGFIRVEDETAPKGEAMRSGAIGDSAGYGLYTQSVLSTTVQGPCTLKFKWRCSCEEDDTFEWDHAEFAVDGVIKARINGIMDGWAEVAQVITEGGTHAVTWTYLKDDFEKKGEDCLWVADYSWMPTELYTHESSVPVPYDWILSYLPHTAYEYDHFEAAVRETAANGVNTVEESYVAGLDPSDPKDKFVAKIEMVDGKSVVTWTPDLNEDGTKSVRTYKTWGKDSLDADEWLEVTPENQGDMRFFKVTVGMP